MKTPWTVESRKVGGTWTKVGTYLDENHARKVSRGLTRGQWESRYSQDAAPNHAPTPLALPPNPNAYDVVGASIKFFIPTGKMIPLKRGGEREETMMVTQQKIRVHCKRSGKSWEYTGFSRQGRWYYSDSRTKLGQVDMAHKVASMPYAKFSDELFRMLGDKALIAWLGVMTPPINKREWEGMFGKVA